jgi:hypothetical protein
MKTSTIYAPFQRVETMDDGSLYVEGIASTEAPVDNLIVSAQAIIDATPEYMRAPAVREQHMWPAGKALELITDNAVTTIAAKIIDSDTIRKIRDGVLRGFSLGFDILGVTFGTNDTPDVAVKIKLIEISVVDLPANPGCPITLYRCVLDNDTRAVLNGARGEQTMSEQASAAQAAEKKEEKVDTLREQTMSASFERALEMGMKYGELKADVTRANESIAEVRAILAEVISQLEQPAQARSSEPVVTEVKQADLQRAEKANDPRATLRAAFAKGF